MTAAVPSVPRKADRRVDRLRFDRLSLMTHTDLTCTAVHVAEWRTSIGTVIVESPRLITLKHKIILFSRSYKTL